MSERTRWVDSGGLRLWVREEGVPGGPTLLLVHGYPDDSAVWDGVVARLADRYRVVRYDVRGAGRSDAPAARDGYRIEHLAADLRAVLDAISPDVPVHLVAHDWGSMQSWAVVGDPAQADRFASFTSISGPDLAQLDGWLRAGLRDPGRARAVLRQLRHSWYMAGFQVPLLPELFWRLPRARAAFQASYRDARNGLGLYRANMVGRAPRPAARRIEVPVQQVALTQDRYCLPAVLTAANPWCARLWRRELVAGHWAVRTHPAEVARFVTEFVEHLAGRPAGRELGRARTDRSRRPLDGRLALVTGAGSGIGRSTALAFARAGADVLCVDIDAGRAQDTAGEVAAHGRAGLAYRLDVADETATQRLAEQVIGEHGVPDLVMANAGIGVSGPFLATDAADWRRVLEVNLLGVVHTLRAFVPALVRRAEGGHVVITASMAGFFPTPSLSAYSTTKAGVLMLAQCLDGELRPAGIGVSAICPGVVHTDITNTARFAGSTAEEERDRRRRATAAYRRRGYSPDRVAVAVLRAVRDKRLVVPVTPEARMASASNRISPAFTRLVGRWVGRQAGRVVRG
ncbi:SDR family oxidoreductase [Actinophytocola sp.]|uniref:SDR family oxidoreductase n=1 Tax=Actinophytocola sp. TaxID=1872138 RepID=UPI002D7EE000|nr:SDR family oxidoreductase [Actinophytocola sp.]HET9139025.1 SDR family oxidoreductase [Actinophytocola sp.]